MTPRFVETAGIWVGEAPTSPCAGCGEPGRVVVADNQAGPYSAPYCSLRCWGDHMDTVTPITGHDTRPRLWRGRLLDWPRVRAGQSRFGPVGISYYRTRDGDDVLTYRNTDGHLVGTLRRSPAGVLAVHVDPARQHHGIGTALVRDAGRRWGIDLAVQQFTPAGFALAEHALPADCPFGETLHG